MSAANSNQSVHTFTDGETLQGRYRIVRQLGAGGMGAVYEAVDDRLQATVAIKETFSVDDRLRRQFEQEARLLAQLSHPALPNVSDYFTENGRAFLVMQFIAGDDLAKIISQQPGPFPRGQVIAWADQLLDALIYLHTRERRIIHRDIKPHNLKLTSSGQIALLDFGLAKTHAADQSTTQSSNSIFGYTRRYSPLEQIQDLGTSPQSDIYALGATLYHLLTGIKPPDALTRAAALANSEPDPLRRANEVHSIVGLELAVVINKALALNAGDRYQSATDFREALRRIGRSDWRGAHSLSDYSTQRTARESTFDPFESYSILKPDEMAWLNPKRPWPIATMIAFTGTLLIVAFILSSYLSRANVPTESVRDYVRANAVKNVNGNANPRENRSEKLHPSSSANTNSTSSPAETVAIRNSEKQKRLSRHPTPAPNDPPAPPLRSALRLPAQ